MSGITTHVLDLARGTPAAGIRIVVARAGKDRHDESILAEAHTDADGRAGQGLPQTLERGTYRITFDTGAYFGSQGVDSFYPDVTVAFEVRDPEQHHHVPLLLSPYGYSTYRGS